MRFVPRRPQYRNPIGLALFAALALCTAAPGCTEDEPPPPVPLHCDPAPAVDCATDAHETLPLSMRGTTWRGEDKFGGASCGLGGDTIEDAAFVWTAPHADTYEISTLGSAFDTFLSVRTASCLGRELECNDDAEDGVVHSVVRMDLDACERILVVVDGVSIDAVGDYALTIRGTEALCDDGTDDDGDGLSDCDDPDCFSRVCPSDDLWPRDWRELEWDELDQVNAIRAAGTTCQGVPFAPAPPLEMDERIRLAARLHSQDMADNNYLEHDGLDGRGPSERVRDAGFPGDGASENILAGTADPAEALEIWLGSDEGHCENLMNPSWQVTGIGYAFGSGGHRWTQNFAVRP